MPAKTSKPKTAQIPKLRFPGFSGAWEEKRLGEICEIITGNTPPTSQRDFYDGNHCFVSPFDIQERRYINTTKTSLSEKGFLKSRKISKDAVLFVCIGSTIGKVAQAGVDCATNQQINSLIANFENSNDFIYSLLSLKAKKIKLLAGEQAVPIINKNDFSKIRLYFPFLPEQQKIAEFLETADEWIENLRAQKESLESYKKGMMQKIFSQQIRFKDDNGKDFPEWEEKKLGEILKIGSGKDYKNLKPGNIPVFGTGGYMLSVDKALHSGESVLIGRKGSIDKPFYYKGDFWTVDTLFYTYGYKNIIPKFLSYIFQGINWLKYNEASGVPSLSKTTIEKIKVRIPSLFEQQKIADFLNSIDNLMELKQQQITQAEQWKSGLMQELFV